MAATMVDFAKHGATVPPRAVEEMDSLIKKYPDFMNSNKTGTYESPRLLGQMYRDIDMEGKHINCLRVEWKSSINFEYSLHPVFVGKLKHYHPYLSNIHRTIVEPMRKEIAAMMLDYHLLNEGELFCTDSSFKVTDQVTADNYVGEAAR